MTASTPEGKLKAACRAWMRGQGAYVFSPVQVGMGATTLDDLVCWRGWFIGIEYKRPDTRPKPTARQATTMKQIERAAGLALVCYDLASVQELFLNGPPGIHVSHPAADRGPAWRPSLATLDAEADARVEAMRDACANICDGAEYDQLGAASCAREIRALPVSRTP